MKNPQQHSAIPSWSDAIEEGLMASLLGLMTVLTFSNVLVRYLFNGNILWALETTVFLFAWMVLLGATYGFKKSLHIGVDVVLGIASMQWKRRLAIFSFLICLGFSLLLCFGSWSYWIPFISERAFLETDDIPMPQLLQFLSSWLNDGERYEKIPRFLPYAILPIASTLMVFRVVQSGIAILRGAGNAMIPVHEVKKLPETER